MTWLTAKLKSWAKRILLAIALWLISCRPTEVQIQACYVAADAAAVERAYEACEGYSWATCPDTIKAILRLKHREELLQCL